MLAGHAHQRLGMTTTQALTAPSPTRAASRPQPAETQRLAPLRRATRREWLFLGAQIGLVAGIELSDDAVHALLPTVNAAAGMANAVRVMDFERAHGFWLEPGIQRFFAGS